MQKNTYTLEIDTLNVIEKYTKNTVTEIHKILLEKLHQLYIPFKNEDFITKRMMQIHMKKTKINDFYIYKCESTIIKLYKLKHQPIQQNQTTLEKNIA
jgi:hypothetical protein